MLVSLLPFFYFVLFAFIIYKCRFFHVEAISVFWNVLLFLAKVLAAYALYWVYTNTYTNRAMSDIFKFFDDSEGLYRLFRIAPIDFFKNFFGFADDFNYGGKYVDWMNNWLHPYGNRMYNDNRMMIRIHTLLRFFSGGNYHVHSVFFAFFSFIGIQFIIKTFKTYIVHHFRWFYLAMFLFPSVIFWGSGCLKESLLIIELGLFIFCFFKIMQQFQWKYLIGILIGITSILFTKFYILIVLIPCMVAFIAAQKWHFLAQWKTYLLVFAGLLTTGIFISFLHPSLDFSRLLISKQHGFVNVAIETQSASIISDEKIEPSWKGIFTFLPQAWYRVVVLPYPWAGKWVERIAGMENVLLLLFAAFTWWKGRSYSRSNAYYFALAFVIILYSIIGITVPVVGAMVRYKVPGILLLLPILWMNLQGNISTETKQ